MSEQNYPSYLIHYGIEGQKWGVRRFQNEDGTYTDEGLLRRKDQKYFVKEQRKINKKFDKLTDKIQARTNAGKRVSDRKIQKALDLGTKHRALDYISQNPRAYLQARGLNKASKAKNAVGVTSGAIVTGVGAHMVASPYEISGDGAQLITYGASGITSSIAQRKVEKMFLDKWMQRQYGEALNKSRNLTLKDLESHGIKFKNKNTHEVTNKKVKLLK